MACLPNVDPAALRGNHSSKTLVLTRATLHHIPEDSILYIHAVKTSSISTVSILFESMFLTLENFH
jgi:hypothetical protein